MTGLYFGSFNPIHMGHLIIAQAVLGQPEVEEVWFVVSPQNPFKQRADLMPDQERLHLVQLAVADNPRLKACDVELSLPQPSYTITTLERLHRDYPSREFALIMGSDNIDGFPRWRQAEQILEHHRIYVYPRPGHLSSPLLHHPQVTLLEGLPLMEISSTHIRHERSAGRSIRYLVPDPVWHELSS